MKCKAYAKVNLSLNVVSRRADGYHELEMIMVPIDLYDVIEITKADRMHFECNDPDLLFDDKNTVVKAIQLLRDKYQFKDNFHVQVEKNIPAQAGLAGGSSDGATTLILLNELLGLNIIEEELYVLGNQIGADVPFCLYGKPAVVKGTGDKFEQIEIQTPFYLLLVKPLQGVSTKNAFERLNLSIAQHPDYQEVKRALEYNDYSTFLKKIGNSLEESASREVPEIAELKQELIEFGFDTALMSGSGSTVFGITQKEELLEEAIQHFNRRYPFVKKVQIINDVKKS